MTGGPAPEDVDDDAAWERFGALGDRPWDGLDVAARTLVALGGLRAEVNNGGFDQYFFNSAGDHAWAAVGLLAEAGLTDVSDLLQQALLVLGATGPLDREGRQRCLEAVPEHAFAELDEAFFDLEGDRLDGAMRRLAARTSPPAEVVRPPDGRLGRLRDRLRRRTPD